MQQVKGVEEIVSGYSGGKLPNPTYREVCSGLTGHAEVVQVKFDPEVISYEELLKVFFAVHNPTLLDLSDKKNSQYRSVIFYHSMEQRRIAEELLNEHKAQRGRTVFTELRLFDVFYKAEENHQNYYRKDPQKAYCQNVIEPKMRDLKIGLEGKVKE